MVARNRRTVAKNAKRMLRLVKWLDLEKQSKSLKNAAKLAKQTLKVNSANQKLKLTVAKGQKKQNDS